MKLTKQTLIIRELERAMWPSTATEAMLENKKKTNFEIIFHATGGADSMEELARAIHEAIYRTNGPWPQLTAEKT